ncbi:MOSC domain-containing protein [Lichenicoccus roseus]|uniref:MOSC domain-containing protein n=1 Tax=Lichenicoccus roseus TaxID=2683649 RepID=UPI001F101883|nr:MOSC domain-containing protein [Lichenicoccus roseus]
MLDAPARPGVVRWIGVRPQRRLPLVAVPEVALDPQLGLDGDHYAGRGSRNRQVTLIAAEQLVAIASYLGLDRIEPGRLRRNLVVAGFNLHGLKGHALRVGDAVLEVTGDCHPCSRMEAEFGPGGYNAVRGHGGVTARILAGGMVRLGDALSRVIPMRA